ncbi:hypothetical protein P7F60_12965 [Rhizobium sp. YJ-22]|uniref:hypothetical protein n=1 Tax=Rhizobium sp. YJ-22 TaxID=3037556 RepID=UPI001AD54523|nr:hypothetical protein [Rhizobium sp. YJ-22]MBN9028199.1 hypothetical protein [Hyphomicrobiales bacterium]MDG3577302.1 hypothetical protein [Rhizobium sp. YJ-22]
MTAQNDAPAKAQPAKAPKTDLTALYRPLGLKAVLAASMMQKKKAPLVKKHA